MNHTHNKSVLITGGSKGIGFAIAREFAMRGHHLILVARNQYELDQAANTIKCEFKVKVKVIAADLARESAFHLLFQKLNEEHITIDILINNAGIGITGHFTENNIDDVSTMLRLNIMALTRLTHLFLQPMIERRQGHIINIGSLVAYFPAAPNWASYVASKHYVRAFTNGIARELKNTGVSITLLSPGATATDFVTSSDATSMRAYQVPNNISVEKIAKAAYAAYKNETSSVIPGLFNKILAFIGELHPRAIAFEALAFLSQKAPKPEKPSN